MKEKVLIIIPAYNEAENIKGVLDDIKINIKYADVLVINDCSKDNTKEIVEKSNIKCITNVFNMGYAMAVQTGIKYAFQNNYDFVIQMDADGQHIASEAEKLYFETKKGNYDIVIGSRYLKNMGYHCPFFRRTGTKMFQHLIKFYCHKDIFDPLSGFQCLNKRVIERYSGIGNYPEYPDANLVIEMLILGYKIKEIPVKMKARESGVSMHSGILQPIKYMIEMFYNIIIIVIKHIGVKKVN